MINLSAEAKNPTRDIPEVIVVSTLAISGFFALIGVVAGGVLPIEQTADATLNVVAIEVMPKAFYLFFVIAGALLALSTTLNASMAFVTKPILQACNDGWLPKKLGYIHPKRKTPMILLTIFYVIGLVPIIFGFNIGMIADIAVILNNILFVLICFGAVLLPKRIPEIWEQSKFKCSKSRLILFSVLGGIGSLITVGLLMMDVGKTQAIGMIIITIVAVVYAFLRYRTGKVDMQDSVEAL